MTSPYLTLPLRTEEEANPLLADARWRYRYHLENLWNADFMDSHKIAFASLSGMAVARHAIQLQKLGCTGARTHPNWKPRS